jgi:DNA-binding LacI/PurR family transcriptional regulator
MPLWQGGAVATIKDVAARAGVAISTVSAVLNRSAPVSEEVIEKVNGAVAAIGYVPHGAARSLRSGQSKLIGLVVPNIANPWCGAVAREVENACLSAGYTSVVYSTGQDAEREGQVLNMMRMQRVAGLIVIPTRSDAEHGSRLIGQIHVPTVLLDMFVEGLPYDVVKTDNVEAGRLATNHLLALGHRRIGIVAGIPGLATSDDRHAGYLKAHAEHGVAVDPALTVIGHFDQDDANAAVRGLLSREDRPTALVVISNMMTMGALFAIRDLDLKVPDDISLVGIDDLEFSGLLDPAPTVVTTPILPMSRHAIDLLFRQIAGKVHPTGAYEIYPPGFIARNSTRPLPA